MEGFRKIGFWQTAHLGDALLSLPVLSALKARFPEAQLHFFVRDGLQGLFADQPELARVYGFAKRGRDKSLLSSIRFGQKLGKQGFDLWISAHTSLRSAIVAYLAGSPRRIGYDSPWFNRLAYTDAVPRRFAELAEIERLFELVRPLGIAPPIPEPRLTLPKAAQEAAAGLWKRHDLAGRTVLGLHPGSTWPTKRWPAERFGAVARFAARSGARVLVFGGQAERRLAAEVVAAAGGEQGGLVLDLAGQMSLPELAAVIGRLSVFLCNDSGPMHLAWIQGVPLVALFGPTTRGLGFFPRGAGSAVLEIDLPCRPCGLHGHASCPLHHHDCLRLIQPERVWTTLAPRLGP
jgi:heptosyltransferase-2